METLTIDTYLSNGAKALPKDVLEMAARHKVRMVDFKFTDLPGTWQHMGLSIRQVDEDTFSEGLGYDGSSIRGFQEIHESDMILLPDPATAVIAPFHEQGTMSIVCNVIDPITREPYTRDPRYVAQKAESYLASTGIADTCFVGPEAEFFIFDSVRYEQTVNRALYEVDSAEGFWNTAAPDNGRPNLGYKLRQKEGYFPVPPGDTLSDLRARMVTHAPAILAFCAPTTNSYRRLVPGYEAPVNLVYSQRNRSAAVRIPVYSASPKAKRLEFRPPDPTANPYLAFSAMLMAGLDGVQPRIDPRPPVDADLYELPAEELATIATVPGSLEQAIDALEADHEFLLKGDVFTQDLIDTWIAYKRGAEIDPVRLRPHPWEFALYYE